MSDTSRILIDTATKLFEEHVTPARQLAAEAGEWPEAAWRAAEEMGLPLALVAEEAGGFGLPMEEALDLIRLAGSFAVPLPLAETMLANRLLADAGLPCPGGPLTLAPVRVQDRPTLERRGGDGPDGGWFLRGEAHRISWGRRAGVVVLATEAGAPDGTAPDGTAPNGTAPNGPTFVAFVPAGQAVLAAEGANLAKEPRDSLRFDLPLRDDQVAPAAGIDAEKLRRLGAALRSMAIAGALERVLTMTVAYANERSQFGRPIGKFQAIQQNLAVMAGQAAAARAAGDIAVDAVVRGGDPLLVATAKIRSGEAAGIVAGIAHQVHGAMGFTHEHSLHLFTKRLWSWRDEFGGEAEWSRRLGQAVARQGTDGLWPLVTAL